MGELHGRWGYSGEGRSWSVATDSGLCCEMRRANGLVRSEPSKRGATQWWLLAVQGRLPSGQGLQTGSTAHDARDEQQFQRASGFHACDHRPAHRQRCADARPIRRRPCPGESASRRCRVRACSWWPRRRKPRWGWLGVKPLERPKAVAHTASRTADARRMAQKAVLFVVLVVFVAITMATPPPSGRPRTRRCRRAVAAGPSSRAQLW